MADLDLNDILRQRGPDGLRAHWDLNGRRYEPEHCVPLVGASGKPRKRQVSFEATDTIIATEYAPLQWAVDGLVAEGFAVLAGRQKLGKSRMALDFAVAVATGGCALGKIEVEQGDVLYIDLENGPRRVQRRLREMFPFEETRPDLSRLKWAFTAPLIGDGFFEMLDDWRSMVAKPRLIIIDVLQRVKPAGGNKTQNSYERDYDCFGPLQAWATKHGIALLALHHTRKGGATDPLEALSGSNGLSAVADTTLVLDRDGQGTTLYVRGRDVEERDSALTSVNGQWHLQGDAEVVRRSDERSRVLSALMGSPEPMTIREVSDETGMKYDNCRFLLTKLVRDGYAHKPKRGLYAYGASDASNASDGLDSPGNRADPEAETEAQFEAVCAPHEPFEAVSRAAASVSESPETRAGPDLHRGFEASEAIEAAFDTDTASRAELGGQPPRGADTRCAGPAPTSSPPVWKTTGAGDG